MNNKIDKTKYGVHQINSKNYPLGGLLTKDEKNFNRLPFFIEERDELNKLIKNPAGVYFDFITNSTTIGISVVLTNPKTHFPHMSLTGTTGFDLYVLEDNKYVFLGTTKTIYSTFDYILIKGMSSKNRQYRLYFPNYNEVLKLEILTNLKANLKEVEERPKPKLIVYGTSITQGASASRPGMSYPAIIGRALENYNVYNLGFSGNAHLDFEIAKFLSEVNDLEILIMEVEANTGGSGLLEERLEEFINIILNKQTNLKIYLVSHFPHAYSLFFPNVKMRIFKNKQFQKNICTKYKDNLEFVDGEKILKEFGFDESVDNVHLSDLGFYKLGEHFINLISKK